MALARRAIKHMLRACYPRSHINRLQQAPTQPWANTALRQTPPRHKPDWAEKQRGGGGKIAGSLPEV